MVIQSLAESDEKISAMHWDGYEIKPSGIGWYAKSTKTGLGIDFTKYPNIFFNL